MKIKIGITILIIAFSLLLNMSGLENVGAAISAESQAEKSNSAIQEKKPKILIAELSFVNEKYRYIRSIAEGILKICKRDKVGVEVLIYDELETKKAFNNYLTYCLSPESPVYRMAKSEFVSKRGIDYILVIHPDFEGEKDDIFAKLYNPAIIEGEHYKTCRMAAGKRYSGWEDEELVVISDKIVTFILAFCLKIEVIE